MSEMADAIRALITEKGLGEESIKQTIENTIKAAYKKTYGTAENCIVKFDKDIQGIICDVKVFSRKIVLDGVWDPSQEIELEEARSLNPECEVGDELDIQIDPKTFARSSVTTGKQSAHQSLNESFKDNLFNEYKDKIGQIMNGRFQREYKRNYIVSLGNGKIEGIIPAKQQSPIEHYEIGENIRVYVQDIKKTNSGIQPILSRVDPRFVEKILELEVPEIADNTISVHRVVREAGYRVKVAVKSNKDGVDAVGSCVGKNGTRITNVIHELEGEKVDVLEYSEDPKVFIANSLSPAKVEAVYILDANRKEALAVVDETQFSLAIGKQGLNVRLANRLCDWTIDVKNKAQFAEMDIVEDDSHLKAAEQLFNNDEGTAEEEYEEITSVCQLPGVNADAANVLKEAGLDDIEKFMEVYDSGKINDVDGITREQVEEIYGIIEENVEFADADEDVSEESEEDEYRCPECGAKIDLSMHKCPNCGVEFEFEED